MNVICHNIMVNIERPAQGVRDLKRAGFNSLAPDISVRVPDFYGRYKNKNSKGIDLLSVSERCSPLFDSCRENGVQISFVYGPSYQLIDPLQDRKVKDNFLKEDDLPDIEAIEAAEAKLEAFTRKSADECIEFCGSNGVKYILIPPISGDRTRGREWELNRDFYMSFVRKAKESGVCILLQNMCRDVGGHLVRGVCAEASDAADWVDRLNEEAGAEVFGVCVDIGICSLCGNNVHEFITTLGSRVKAVVLRDCDGHNDVALMPFSCARRGVAQTDWMGLIRGLRDIDYDGELIVNCSDTARAFSPLLRPTVFRLAKEAGDYIRWQVQLEQNLKKYKSIVLFGAGNMCRNYMKCYGEQYPPLFTCDNNPKLWNTEFEGLTVKNPEELRNLPEGCGVYICNIYYREIETQLKEMGIKNIEYFNDEYMPTFYFDRLERDNQ
ncbi:MAG: sugar phosphate isomerase/epimerase [Lachnospiraceae bacterium]|nr:sugar phosphate isomerase/epimerase [Lachnospiraceae bacterium]